jgi:hypothetical protein
MLYQPKEADPIEALLYNGDGEFDEVTDWLQDAIEKQRLVRHPLIPKKMQVAAGHDKISILDPGSYLTRDKNGNLDVITADELNTRYELVD